MCVCVCACMYACVCVCVCVCFVCVCVCVCVCVLCACVCVYVRLCVCGHCLPRSQGSYVGDFFSPFTVLQARPTKACNSGLNRPVDSNCTSLFIFKINPIKYDDTIATLYERHEFFES